MRYITCEIPESVANIFPLGDLHLSDKLFRKESYKKLKEIISFIGENPNSRIVFGGDLFNMAGRNTKSSPFEARLSVNDEMNELVSFFYPIKDKIAGAIRGNHEDRSKEEFDIDIMEVFCSKLGIPYLGYSGVVNFRVGKKNAKSGGQWNQNYYGYFHHTTGGGSTIGSGLNRVEKLNNIVEGCDFYCGFHSHKTSYANSLIYTANHRSKKIEEREIHFVTCGGYLEYPDSYAEKGMMRPVVVGSPMIILEGNKRKISFVN